MSEYGSIPARPTLYKGIRMRSRLEADFAAFLDRQGSQWEYEPECFGADGGQWLPDFRIHPPGDHPYPIYVELKPAGLLDQWFEAGDVYERINALLRKMETALESDPECILWLVFWVYGETWRTVPLMLERLRERPWLASVKDCFLQFQWCESLTMRNGS